MMQELIRNLNHWNSATTERQKLQHVYLALIVAIIVLAGIVSLVSANRSHQLASIALAAIGTFLANAVVWNLLNSAVLQKLPSKPKRK